MCCPLLAVVVFHETLYGRVRSSLPKIDPVELELHTRHPVSSRAFARTLTVPETVALFAGCVTATVGG